MLLLIIKYTNLKIILCNNVFTFQASQTFILLKNVLSNEPVGAFNQMIEILEYWKNLIQKMSTNPKVYELTPYSK